MNFCSTYSRFFGKYTEPTRGEAEILRYKKFSELKISSVLTQKAVAYIEGWTLLNEDDVYLNLALGVIRQIYTFIKSKWPLISTNTESYFWPKKHELVSPSRFDTIEKTIRKNTHKNMHNQAYNKMIKESERVHYDKVDFVDKKIGIDPA